MKMGNIHYFLDHKTILVTGATGFLAKIFVEKILRVQPHVKKLYLLVRASDAESALQRFNTEVVEKDLFNVLKEKYGANLQSFLLEKVTPIAADITRENLGIQDSSMNEKLWREVDVVVNVAANTKFTERYDVAMSVNAYGAKFVLDFAKKCVNLKMLLHVSTAFVSGEKPGLILETPYCMGDTLNGVIGLDINQEKRIIKEKLQMLKLDGANDNTTTLAMKDLGMRRASHYGWPNTYVFTKALGEMVLGDSIGDIPLVILRPSIICSTYKEPFPGWVEGIRTGDAIVEAYGKGQLKCFLFDPESVYDTVPADMVVNAMVAIIVAHADQTRTETIYHVGSSISNPLKCYLFPKIGFQYFTQNPWINNDGKPVKVSGKIRILTSMASFHRYITLRYLLPLKVFKVVNIMFCQAFAEAYNNLERKINWVQRMVKLYEPYVFSKGLYDDTNLEKLRKALRESENEESEFQFDPRIFDWEDYILHTHLPALVKYEF